MGNFVIGRLLRWAAGRLNGYKSRIGGFGMILTGLAGAIGYMFPDTPDLPKMDIEMVLGAISLGFTILGNAGKQEKLKDEIQRLAGGPQNHDQ